VGAAEGSECVNARKTHVFRTHATLEKPAGHLLLAGVLRRIEKPSLGKETSDKRCGHETDCRGHEKVVEVGTRKAPAAKKAVRPAVKSAAVKRPAAKNAALRAALRKVTVKKVAAKVRLRRGPAAAAE